MFWKKKPDPNPMGVALGDLMKMLSPTSIKATLTDHALVAQHEHYTVRVEVVAPDTKESDNGPIRTVVRVIADLPNPLKAALQGPEISTTATLNAFAGLAACRA